MDARVEKLQLLVGQLERNEASEQDELAIICKELLEQGKRWGEDGCMLLKGF